jgi:hypothetical protein
MYAAHLISSFFRAHSRQYILIGLDIHAADFNRKVPCLIKIGNKFYQQISSLCEHCNEAKNKAKN